MKNAKKIVAILLMAMLACSSFVFGSASASNVPTIAVEKNLWEEDFERYKANTVWERKALYLMDAEGKVVDSNVIKGNKSLSVDCSENTWGSIYVKEGTVTMQNSVYRFSLKLKTKYIDAVNIEVRSGYGNGTGAYYSEYGYGISCDASGNAVSIFDRAGNLGAISVTNASHVLNANGVVDVTFDFSAADNNALIFVCFHSVSGHDGNVICDEFCVKDLLAKADELKVVYDGNFDDVNTSNEPYEETPFWCNVHNFDWNYESPFGGNAIEYSGYYYMSNGDNVRLGGLTAAELTTQPNKLYYFSFDIQLIDVKEFVIAMLDDHDHGQVYSEIKYHEGVWTLVAAGGISGFTAEYDENDCWHVSFYKMTSSYGYDEFRLYATSVTSQTSHIIIDNFTLAVEK